MLFQPYLELQSQKIGKWYVMSGRPNSDSGFYAWAKLDKLTAKSPLQEVGVVYFEIGETRQQAVANLINSDLNIR